MTLSGLFESQMAMYTSYHRDPRNRITHFFGIPAIVFSILVALALFRVSIAGVEVSYALLVAFAVLCLWISLDLAIGLGMALFLVPCFFIAEYLAHTGEETTVWSVFAILFVGGWILQLWGHVYEGRRPALMSNLFQALIGPMFLVAELFFLLGWKLDLKRRIDQILAERYPQYPVSSEAEGGQQRS